MPFRDDPSNRDPRHPRTRIREEVVPLLMELNPRADAAVVRLSALAAADSGLLREQAEELLESATVERQGRVWRGQAAALADAPSALLSRALIDGWARAAPPETPPPGAEWVAGAMRFVRGGRGGKIAGPGGVTLRRRGKWLEFRGDEEDDD
jgi:hypothetical protein